MGVLRLIAGLKYRKVKSATLVEVVVSMSLVMMVIGIGFYIVSLVNKNSLLTIRTKAERQVELILSETILQQSFINESYAYPDFTVNKEIVALAQSNDLIQIKLIAVQQNGTVLFIKNKLEPLP